MVSGYLFLLSGYLRTLFLDRNTMQVVVGRRPLLLTNSYFMSLSLNLAFHPMYGDPGKTIEYSLWSPILVTYLFSLLPHYNPLSSLTIN